MLLQIAQALLGIHDHRAKLEHVEEASVTAATQLAEQDRTGGVEPD